MVFEVFRCVEKTCAASLKKKRNQENKYEVIINKQHSHNEISLEAVKILKCYSELKKYSIEGYRKPTEIISKVLSGISAQEEHMLSNTKQMRKQISRHRSRDNIKIDAYLCQFEEFF